MPTPETIAKAFKYLDFHDDTFVEMKVLPSQCPGDGGQSFVEIQLSNASEMRTIRFLGCANLRVAMDFDVLAGNLLPNTSRVDAHTHCGRMRNLMESQKTDWDVTYAKTARSPLADKLAALNEYVSFRVQFFGGAVDVIAREYQVITANRSPHTSPAPE
ncbi:MAG TPA: hypothetical protein VGI88_05465 [Verrucomicrobiae bacterium]|jgi:hypothetical protein